MNAPPNALRSTTVTFGTVGLGERVDELGAVTDHAALLLLGAGHEAGRVDEHDEREAERVAGAHEARALGAGVGVEHAAQVAAAGWRSRRPRGRRAARSRRRRCAPSAATNSSRRPPSTSAADDVAHVVDLALVGRAPRSAGVEPPGLGRAPARRALRRSWRQVVEQVADEQRRVGVGLGDEVGDAVALVDLVAAERRRP